MESCFAFLPDFNYKFIIIAYTRQITLSYAHPIPSPIQLILSRSFPMVLVRVGELGPKGLNIRLVGMFYLLHTCSY